MRRYTKAAFYGRSAPLLVAAPFVSVFTPSSPIFSSMRSCDQVLKYLTDVKASTKLSDGKKGFQLAFCFAPNPFFDDEFLTKARTSMECCWLFLPIPHKYLTTLGTLTTTPCPQSRPPPRPKAESRRRICLTLMTRTNVCKSRSVTILNGKRARTSR